VVPVEVTSGIAGTTSIAILAEKNASPLISNFNLSGGAQGFISTRIKMGQTSLVRAVVKAGGKSYTAAKEVKVTIGGCGG
jgi:sulfur-oxidizing protein SoxY